MHSTLRNLLIGLGLSPGLALATPHFGDTLAIQQPDGTMIRALAYGDHFAGRLESLDGYTLIKNPETGRFEYADRSDDSTRLIPSGVGYYDREAIVRPGKEVPPERKPPARLKPHLDVKPGVRIQESRQRRQKAEKEKLEGRLRLKKLPPGKIAPDTGSPAQPGPGTPESGPATPFGSAAPQALSAAGPTTGTILGITLVVDFPDEPLNIPVGEIDDYLNEVGYSGYGNNGSVRDFFRDVSGGALDYQNVVPAVLRMPYPKTWYADPANNGRDTLVFHALTTLDARGFDFSTLSQDTYDNIRAINLFYAGGVTNNWAEGIWPHRGSFYGFSADGVHSYTYQMTDIGFELTLGTFCHENGHLLFDWPDLYDYDRTAGGSTESYGIGSYGLMGNVGSQKNPVPPHPSFRMEVGWETPVDLTEPLAREYAVAANALTSLRWRNPAKPEEYFLIEARKRSGRNASLPDEGLLVWHIDESVYGNNSQEMTEALHYRVSVEQADGQFHLESGSNRGGAGDLFHAGHRDAFGDSTLPDSKWWNGATSGLELSNISAPGDTMTFSVRNSLWTLADIGNPSLPGTAAETSDGRIVMEGGGADIWNIADQFSFRYQHLTGNGEVVARIDYLELTDPWAKAGVMLRESLEPGSRNVFLAITPSNGIAFQTRALRGGGTSINQTAGGVSHWMKLVRRGDRLEGFTSADGATWTAFGYAVLPVGESLLAGLAVTSHNNATLATAVATGLKVERSPWNGADLGLPALAGRHEVHGGTFTVQAAGADIWGNADEGYFLGQPFSGEGRLVARVQSLGNTDPWAKAGVMFRAGTGASDANTFAAVTPANGAVRQTRSQAGGGTVSTQHTGISAPQWVRLDHRNGEMIAYRSANGFQWTEIARNAATPLGTAGLAVTSHRTDLTTTAVFDQVRVQKGFPALEIASVQYGETAGNGNFTLNPGETGWLRVSVLNPGSVEAQRIRGTFSSPDGCFSPPSGEFDFGDIASGATSPEIEIAFTVTAGCEGGNHDVSLLLTDTYGDTHTGYLSLYVEKFYEITGTVRDPFGAAIAGAEIECSYFHFSYSAASVANGTYRLEGLRPGTYTCRARTADRPDSPTQDVILPPSGTADFVLTRPLLSLNTAAVTATLPSGEATTVTRTLSNPGDSPLTFETMVAGAGYAWLDSDAPSGPAPVWNDISGTGTVLSFDQGISAAMAVRNLGFSFPFYDSAYTGIFIAPSGYASFNDHFPYTYDVALPSPYAPTHLVAGYWDEIDARSGGAVYFQEFGDRAVIQYQDVPRLFGTGTFTFQIVLQANGEILVHFHAVPTDADGTTGIQDQNSTFGILVASGQNYAANNKSVRFFPVNPPWLSTVPASGTLPPGASLALNLNLDAAELPAGLFRDSLILTNNSAFSRVSLPVNLTVEGSAGGGLLREVWLASGTSIASLTNLSSYPAQPYASHVITNGFETPVDASDYYGQRVRGYIVPPTTGNYTFWVASDDNSSLRLSTDEHPGRATEIARVSTWTGSRQWEAFAEQRSAPRALVAGRRYYVEALHKEGAGGDNLAVGWQGPGITGDSERPIPVSRLEPFDAEEWFGLDVGGVCATGSHQAQGSGFTVQAGGADIWGTADEFRFVYRVLQGDGVLTARVASLGNTHAWAKAGLMIRESLAAGARNALIAVSPGNGTSFQRRTQTGGSSVNNTVSGGAPRWLRLERRGDLIIASRSSNGTTWTQIGTVNLSIGKEVMIGLAVTSHNDCTATQAVFESVTLE